jgi:N-acetylneuraminic acid mutarotase
MRNIGLTLALPAMLAGGLLLAASGCGEDAASPTAPDLTPALSDASALGLPSNSWTARAGVPDHHSGFAVGASENAAGQSLVYIFGGGDEEGNTSFPPVSAYTYNVSTNAWNWLFNTYMDAANFNGVGKIGNKFYLTGGMKCCEENFETWSKTWAFDQGTGKLTLKANMPHPTMSGVTGVIDGKLYVLPGYCSGEAVEPGHCAVGGPIRQLYRYNPMTNTWTTRMKAPHFHTEGAAGVIGDKFYVVGGNAQGRYLDVYDPATNTWQTRAPIPTAGDQLFGAAIQSKLFVISWSSNGGNVVSKAYLYDPVTNTWKARAAPPNGLAGPIVKVMLNGVPRLFLPGGFGPSYLYTP